MGNKQTRNETGEIRDARTMNEDSIGFLEEGSSVDAISTVDHGVPSMSGLPGEVLDTQRRGNSDKNLQQSFTSSFTERYTSALKFVETNASLGNVSSHSSDSMSTHNYTSESMNKLEQHASLSQREIGQNRATRNFGRLTEAEQVNPLLVSGKGQWSNDEIKEKSKHNILKKSVGFGSVSSDINVEILASISNTVDAVDADVEHITEGVKISTNEEKMSERLKCGRDYVRKHTKDTSELPEGNSFVQSESDEGKSAHCVTLVSFENAKYDFTEHLRSKATNEAVDNRITLMNGNMADDKWVRQVIYSNIMFFPDKSKGATPKRYGPRYLGSRPQDALSASVKSSSSESDVELTSEKNVKGSLEQSDQTSESQAENGTDIVNGELSRTPQATGQAAIGQGTQQQFESNCLSADSDQSLMFFDNHFGLNTGDCASGFSSTFVDYNFYPNKIPALEIDKEQTAPDSTLEYKETIEEHSSKYLSITGITKNEGPVTEIMSSEVNRITISTRHNRSFIACENQSEQNGYNKKGSFDDLLVLMDTERLTHLRKKATTPDSKNCFAALIDWHNLKSRQGCFAKDLKSVCTYISEDNRLCFEFGFKPCNGYVTENVADADSSEVSSSVLHRSVSSDSSNEFLQNDLDDSSSEGDSVHEEDEKSEVDKEIILDKYTRVMRKESHDTCQKIVSTLIPNGHVSQDTWLSNNSPLTLNENAPLDDEGQDLEVVSKKQNITCPGQVYTQFTFNNRESFKADSVSDFTHFSENVEKHTAETTDESTDITVKADLIVKEVSTTNQEDDSPKEILKILSETKGDRVFNTQYELMKNEQTESCMDKDKENAEEHYEFMNQDKEAVNTLSELVVKDYDEKSCRNSKISSAHEKDKAVVEMADTECYNVFDFKQENNTGPEIKSSSGIIEVTKSCSKALTGTGADNKGCDPLVNRNKSMAEASSSGNVNINETPDEVVKSSDKRFLLVFTSRDKYKSMKTSPDDDNRLVVSKEESEKESDDKSDTEESDVSTIDSPVESCESSLEPDAAALLPVMTLLGQSGMELSEMVNLDIDALLEQNQEGLTKLVEHDPSSIGPLHSHFVNLLKKMRKKTQEETVSAMSSKEESQPEVLPNGVIQMDANIWDDVIKEEKQRCELHMINAAKENNRCTVVCVDISGSMSGENWHLIKNMLTQFVNGLEDVRQRHSIVEYVSMVVFGEETNIAVLPTTQYEALPQKFDCLECKGSSPLLQGLRLSSSVLEEMKYRGKSLHGIHMAPRIILLSDGWPTPSAFVGDVDTLPKKFYTQAMNECLEKLPDMKWLFIFIPVGPNPDLDFFLAMSKKVNGKTVSAEEVSQLANSTYNYYRAAQIARPFLKAEEDNMDSSVVRSLARTLHSECSETDITEITDIVVEAHKKMIKKKTKKKSTFSGLDKDEDENSDMSDDDDSEDDDCHQFQEHLPPLGTRVVKGPDAKGIFEYTSKCGTVTGHSKKRSGSLFICWDSDLSTYASYGTDDKYEVVIEDSARPSRPEDSIHIGCKVRRGPDWQFGDQDGGSDQLGVVYQVLSANRVDVHWPNKRNDVYRYNKDGIYDIVISDPKDPLGMKAYVSDMNKKNTALSEGRDPLDDVDDETDESDDKNKNA